MKIAVSGASHTGKSTIVNHLRDALVLPLVGENRIFLQRILNDHDDINKMAKRARKWVYEKDVEEKFFEGGSYVSDRCSIDIFSFCLVHPRFRSFKDAKALHDLCKHQCMHYDYLVIPPWGSVTFREIVHENPEPIKKLDNRKIADLNPWFNLHRQTTILGIAQTWLPPEKILLIPQDIIDIDERISWIKEKINS